MTMLQVLLVFVGHHAQDLFDFLNLKIGILR